MIRQLPVAQPVQQTLDEVSPPLSAVEFCVIDLETTGGSNEHNQITEIGAVKYRGGEELGRFNTLVNPGCAIPSFIVLLTGITDLMVMNAPPVADVLDDLLEFVGDAVLVAHNARFDIGFINAALVNNNRERLTNKVLDTVGLARRLVGSDVENCKLSTLAASLGLHNQPSHRAITDVLATADLLHFLIERAAGFGVFDLEDFSALAKFRAHPEAQKLKMTQDLPRAPGVYLFVDFAGKVLYVGKATNLRSRVRSYFGTNDTRRKVGSLLKLVQGIHYIQTPDALTAEILELRVIARLRPRYNRAGTRSEGYCYVRLTTDEQWPRLVITKTPSTRGISLGPISTRSMARNVIDAIESVVPLRRCTVRMGRKYRAPLDAPVCSAAQLGLAHCPCSGTADVETYGAAVQAVVETMHGGSVDVIERLTAKMLVYSLAQRFEEAGDVRDRIDALETVLRRQRQAKELCDAGRITFVSEDVVYEIECGILVGTRLADQLFTPFSAGEAGRLGVQRAVAMPLLDVDIAELTRAPDPRLTNYPISSSVVDEVMCIARFIESQNQQVA